MMNLKEIIINKITTAGPITFHDYMDMCLYYPHLGYYTTSGPKIGKEGDYYTSGSLTSSFGAIIARQLEEMWGYLDKSDFTIVEYGAGTGALCMDILAELSKSPALYNGLRYCIIEKSANMRKNEQDYLQDNNKVSWYGSIREIPGEIDCVFSNELLDNFPVHLVVMEAQLMEIFVDYKDGFIELLQPASQQLKDYFRELGISLEKGYRTEVNLDALSWMREITDCMKKGFVMTIDYGDISERLYKPHRKDGTIVCYHGHKVSQNPFCDIGAQDITAHLNFSALENFGERGGLKTCGLTYQAYFLSSLGFKGHMRAAGSNNGQTLWQKVKEESAVSYTLLFDMGMKYKVLIQSKGLPETKLTGLQLDIS